MEVKLCTYNDDPRRVGKNPTVIKTLQMNPVTTTNLMNPVFTCDYDSSILLCNYAIVQDFSRKYFVNPPDLIKGGRLQFAFHVDVLECGWLGCKGTVIRNQYKTNTDVEDKILPLKFGEIKPQCIPLPLDLTEYTYPSTVMSSFFDYLVTR